MPCPACLTEVCPRGLFEVQFLRTARYMKILSSSLLKLKILSSCFLIIYKENNKYKNKLKII